MNDSTVEVELPGVHRVSDRCLRCFNEQQWYAESFLYDYFGDENVAGKRILEIGCAEAGLLKYYNTKGAVCSGIELTDTRYNNALVLNQPGIIHLFQADICIPETYQSEINHQYDYIVLRDVIEHIEEKETALKNIHGMLKEDGKMFMSFPPKYCSYAGHQQVIPKWIGKLPYLYLLPNFLYRAYLNLLGLPEQRISYFLSTKRTRISIKNMKRLIDRTNFEIKKEDLYLLRPAYSFRFGLPRIKNPFSSIPGLNEFMTNGALYLLRKKSI